MYIKNIEYIDKQEGEAYITLADEKFEIKNCFICESHPLKINENDKIILRKIYCLGADEIYISNQNKSSIAYKNNVFNITCQITDKENSIGKINDITIYISRNLPGDIENGDYIEFVTNRLDIFEKDIEILN